jgi:ATP-binding cassette subfamily F protein 3
MGKKWSRKVNALKLLGKANRQQETYLHQRGCSLFASAFITTDGATVMEEASKAFGEIFGMKADIDEINEQLTIRTDYESDAY